MKRKPESPKAPKITYREITEPGLQVSAGIEEGSRYYVSSSGCSVIVSQHARAGWHLSIAHPRRYPTWDEVTDARYRFLPEDAWMAMDMPPPAFYVNLHNFCFQLHQRNYPQSYQQMALERGLNPDMVFWRDSL